MMAVDSVVQMQLAQCFRKDRVVEIDEVKAQDEI
jgi:hypothetical protein